MQSGTTYADEKNMRTSSRSQEGWKRGSTTLYLLYLVETHIGRGGMPIEQLVVTKRVNCVMTLTERVSTFPSGE